MNNRPEATAFPPSPLWGEGWGEGPRGSVVAATRSPCQRCRGVLETDRQFQRQVNAAYVDPGYIAKVRKKLDLDQRQAAEIFGGGVNAFSRYENGKTKPPLALVKLLKVLERHPELLNEIRTA
ncbi:type II TA system antitoxin MqsA family protein [Ramlibacter sp. 2FC]|uniref:type II TA system antitoxin MqsA family protein n=1 Tax=Ramlibacter sp. 2FC TaxID=2502188 RepID=UPI0024C294A4|nr:type II TA system antitoxin MqsA family protein [Ramlibacter sp. 2FC]